MDARRTAGRICLGLSLALAAIYLGVAAGYEYGPARELWLVRATGYSALGSLLLALSATPVSRLLRRSWPLLLALRRAFGISAAGFALAHASLVIATAPFSPLWHLMWRPQYRSGLVAAVILALLAITSFPRLVRALGIRLWKNLHRLAYLGLLLVVQHLLLAPFAPRRLVLALAAAVVLLGLLRLLPVRVPAPPA